MCLVGNTRPYTTQLQYPFVGARWKMKTEKNSFVCGFMGLDRNKCKGQFLVHFTAWPKDSVWSIREKGCRASLQWLFAKKFHEIGARLAMSKAEVGKRHFLISANNTTWLQCGSKNGEKSSSIWLFGDFCSFGNIVRKDAEYRSSVPPQRPLASSLQPAALNKDT